MVLLMDLETLNLAILRATLEGRIVDTVVSLITLQENVER